MLCCSIIYLFRSLFISILSLLISLRKYAIKVKCINCVPLCSKPQQPFTKQLVQCEEFSWCAGDEETTLQYDIPPHEGVKTTSTSRAEKNNSLREMFNKQGLL